MTTFVIDSMDININIDEFADEILTTITEECNNAIYNCFDSLKEIDNFYDNNEKDINKMEQFVRRRVAEKLLED